MRSTRAPILKDTLVTYDRYGNERYVTSTADHIYEAPYCKDYADSLKPVGQIVRFGDHGEVSHRFCSGSNIGLNDWEGYFLTAGHCLSSDNVCYMFDDKFDLGNTRITYDYAYMYDARLDNVVIPKVGSYFKPQRVVDHGSCNIDYGSSETDSSSKDYAVFQLDAQAIGHNRSFLRLSTETPAVGNNIIVGHHPAGTAKKLSFGRVQASDQNQINHTAFTLGGSSGGPIIDRDTRAVVAVHIAGSVGSNGLPDQQSHYGVTVNQIANVAKINGKNWIYNVGLFKKQPSGQLAAAGRVIPYRPEPSGGCC